MLHTLGTILIFGGGIIAIATIISEVRAHWDQFCEAMNEEWKEW